MDGSLIPSKAASADAAYSIADSFATVQQSDRVTEMFLRQGLLAASFAKIYVRNLFCSSSANTRSETLDDPLRNHVEPWPTKPLTECAQKTSYRLDFSEQNYDQRDNINRLRPRLPLGMICPLLWAKLALLPPQQDQE